MTAKQPLCIVGLDAFLDRPHLCVAVEVARKGCRQFRLRFACVALAKQRLAMKIGELDHVIIDDRQLADPRSCERRNGRAADAARANNCDRCVFKLALPHPADLAQHDLACIAVKLVVGEVHRPVEPNPPAPRLVSLSASISRKFALSSGAATSWAMRSPRLTSNGSEPRLARITFTSPR